MAIQATENEAPGGLPVHVRLWPADRNRLDMVAQYLRETGTLTGPVTQSAVIREALKMAAYLAEQYYRAKTSANDGD